MDTVVFSAVGQQCDIHAGRIRAVVPGIVVIQPAQRNGEILHAGAHIVQIVFMSQRNIKADTIGNRIPRRNTGSIGRCGVENLTRYAVINSILRQTINGVRPAG